MFVVIYIIEGVVWCLDINFVKEFVKKELGVEVFLYEEFFVKYVDKYGEKMIIGIGCKNVYFS